MSKLKEMRSAAVEKKPGASWLYTGLAVAFVVFGAAVLYMIFFSSPAQGGSAVDMAALENGGHSKGNPSAKVRIVEFGDFECPACGFAFPTVSRIFKEYGDRIYLTYRQFPLNNIHPRAQKAAEASECAAEQGKFWEYHDLLFENQERLLRDDLNGYASQLSLNRTEFDSCLDSGKYASKTASDFSLGVSAGVNSTPTFFVNGEKYNNMSFEQFKSIIEQELNA